MNLLIDAGNTSTKLCVFDAINGYRRVSFEWLEGNIARIEQLAYAQVAPSELLHQAMRLVNDKEIPAHSVSVTANAFGIDCGYNNFQTLGIDRWLAIIASEALFNGQDVLIVDAGTAMTVDVLTESKQHLGGWILPGLSLMQQAIIDKAPGVFSHESLRYEHFGTNTPSALYSGCINGLCGTIEKAKSYLNDIEFHASENLKVVMTGGDAHLLASHLPLPVKVEPNLVFMGLNRFLADSK